MKRIILNQYINTKKTEFKKILLRMDRGRSPIRRLRAETEKAIILKMDRLRWDKWIKEEKIKILGERRYKIRLSG